jgi:hypothetical protein
MPIATEENIQWITRSWLGLHFTPEQAETLKRRIDLMTDRHASCPCTNCRLAATNKN